MPRPIYVPTSKRKPPEYTMGDEYVYADTRKEYIGLYVNYPNGTKYSVPFEDKPERELAIMTTADRSPNTSRYAQITQLQFYKKYEPILYYPTITDKNRQAGFVDRAFAQKINEPDQITEITTAEAFKASPGNEPGIDTNRYRVGILQWSIAGNNKSIRDRNNAAITRLERTIPGIRQFLNDLLEFSMFKAPAGFHYMPDGTLMKNEDHMSEMMSDMTSTYTTTTTSTLSTPGTSTPASSAPSSTSTTSTSTGGSVGY